MDEIPETYFCGPRGGLTRRVLALENTVADLLRILTDDATIKVTDPDNEGHIQDDED